MICVPSGANLPDTLINTPIIQSEDGSGLPNGYSASAFAFGINPEDDPELAMVSHFVLNYLIEKLKIHLIYVYFFKSIKILKHRSNIIGE